MKKYFILLFLASCITGSAQTERNLEDTKSYILKILNENGWRNLPEKNRPQAEFDGDLLQIVKVNSILGQSLQKESLYDFSNVYRFGDPIRKPGNIAHLIIWVDYSSRKHIRWKKQDFEIYVDNFETGEQLMIAFKHLNKLLSAKKSTVEKF